MAKTKLDFLNTREKRDLRRAANAMESVMKSLRDRRAKVPQVPPIQTQDHEMPADLVLWSYMKRALNALMTSSLVLGSIEGHDKRLDDEEKQERKAKGIQVVSR